MVHLILDGKVMAGAAASPVGIVTFLPGIIAAPNLAFAVTCKTPPEYKQAIFVNFYVPNPDINPDILKETDETAEIPVGTYNHAKCQYRIVCFLEDAEMTDTDEFGVFTDIMVRHLVSGTTERHNIVVHEYYGFTRCVGAKPILKKCAELNGRSVGEILNTYLFAKLYDYVRLSDDRTTLIGNPDASDTTLTSVSYTHLTLPTNREV